MVNPSEGLVFLPPPPSPYADAEMGNENPFANSVGDVGSGALMNDRILTQVVRSACVNLSFQKGNIISCASPDGFVARKRLGVCLSVCLITKSFEKSRKF